MSDEINARITEYLANGGLVNPEMANHYAVRDLIMDCRDALAAAEARVREVEAKRDDIEDVLRVSQELVARHRDQRLGLEEALRSALSEAEWMSGSNDFSPGGVAHEGWLKALPRLNAARAALSRVAELESTVASWKRGAEVLTEQTQRTAHERDVAVFRENTLRTCTIRGAGGTVSCGRCGHDLGADSVLDALVRETARVATLEASLRSIEWCFDDHPLGWWCPECGNERDRHGGHREDCHIAAALAAQDAKGEEKPERCFHGGPAEMIIDAQLGLWIRCAKCKVGRPFKDALEMRS